MKRGVSNNFLKFTALCAGLTSFTTFSLWLLSQDYTGASTDLDRAMQHANPFYMGRLWVNFVHIFLALMAYLGAALLITRRSLGLALAGFLWFLLWGFTELLGVSVLILAVNNGLRKSYVNADEATRTFLQRDIDLFIQWWDALFFLILICFLLGTLFYGMGTWKGPRIEKVMSLFFLAAVPLTLGIAISGYTSLAWPGRVAGIVYPVLQPLGRAVLGVWIWTQASQHRRTYVKSLMS